MVVRRRRYAWLAAGCWSLLAVASATATDVESAEKWLAEARTRVLKPDQGARLLKLLTEEIPDSVDLPNAAPPVIELAVLAHLSQGDVTAAQTLLETADEARASMAELDRAIGDTALVAGDARQAIDHLHPLPPAAEVPDESSRTQRARHVARIGAYRELLRNVGTVFEPVELELTDGNPLTLPTPGQPAIVVFWQQAEAPDPEIVAALTAAAELEPDVEVTLLAVNSDSQNARDAVIAAQTGWPDAWQHHLEPRPIRPPLTFRTFEIRHLPAVAVLDRAGGLRAVLPASDPRAVYAARAVVRETAGAVPTIIPVTRDGQRPALRGLEEPIASTEEASAEQAAPTPPAADEPTAADSAEADKLLQTAHSMRRMRSYKRARELYEEIIEKYPGTPQAAEAREYLDRMPR